MNVLRFMAAATKWMNGFVDDLSGIEAVEGEKPPSMLNTQVIALWKDEAEGATGQVAYDVVGIETLPGGYSMVIRLATPPETISDDAQEAQDEEEAIQEA